MWRHINSLEDLKSRLEAAIDHSQALAIRSQSSHLRKMLTSIAAKVSAALGTNKTSTVIRITGPKKKAMADFAFVITNNDIILDPPTVHKTCTRHFQRHHSINSTMFPVNIDWHDQSTVNETFDQFQQHCVATLPAELHGTIDALWTGFTSPWTSVSSAECSRRLQTASTALSPCLTLTELKEAIARSPSSSPGLSGLSFTHIKLWSPPTVVKIHQMLCMLWEDNHRIPDHWHWKLLCPIPKADKDPQALDNLRPIMLVESLRKLWVGILIRRLSVFLTAENFLSSSQHGYTAHHSTVTSGLQLVDNLDDFDENRIDIFLSSWDFTKAFDSLPFSLSRFALQRAFIPSDLADWLLHLDTDGKIITRTPYALDCLRQNQLHSFRPFAENEPLSYFKAGGGVAQGDVHSPYVWRLFIDILLRALEHIRPLMDQFHTINTSDLGYADDIVSLTSSLKDLQSKADLVSAFSIITGISISWTKLRATFLEWNRITDPPPSLKVWDTTLVPHDVPLVRGQTIRHLGFQISTTGNSKDSLEATSKALRKSTAHLVRRSKWLPGEAVLQTTALQTVAQVTYTTQLSTYTSAQLESLDKSLFKVYRAAVHHWPTFPASMLHSPPTHCGLGLPAISTTTYQAKNRILQRSLHYTKLGDDIIQRYLRYHGINPTLHFACDVPDPRSRPAGASGYWLDNLLQHCSDCGLMLKRGGHSTALTSETQLVEFLPALRPFWIEEGLTCLGDLYNPNTHSWITLPTQVPHNLPPCDVVDIHHLLRVGQYWKVSATSSTVHEILHVYSAQDIHTRVWELVDRRRQQDSVLHLIRQHSGPHSYDELFGSVDVAERIYPHKYRLANGGATIRQSIWLREAYPIPVIMSPKGSLLIDDILNNILTSFDTQPIKIFTDGSWKAQGSATGRALLFNTASIGGCSLVILADSPRWKSHPVLVYSITDDASSPTEHAYTWELMALAIAALIQSRHPSSCKLFSDCTSAIHTVAHATPSSALLDQHSTLLYPVANLPSRPVIQHIAAHPEIHIRDREWTQDEWGIHFADTAASRPQDLTRYTDVHTSISSIPSSQVLPSLLDLGTWTWCYESGVPVLLPLKSIWQQHSFRCYLTKRDTQHAAAQVPDRARWLSRSWRLAAKVHRFSSSPTMTRARLQRILLHWSGIGVNLHRDDPDCVSAHCPVCSVPESESHLLRDCEDHAIRELRVAALLDAARYIQKHATLNPLAAFMVSLHAAVEDHPHGYLLYFGFITSQLAATLPQLPNNDIQIAQAQKTVIGYLQILSQSGNAIIDLARARRHTQLSQVSQPSHPSHAPAPHARVAAATSTAHPPRRQASTKHQARRLKRLAHEAGLVDYHTKRIERNHTITDYFQRHQPPENNPTVVLPLPPRREYGTTRPP